MASDLSGGRNVHIYSANDRHNAERMPLGGLILTKGITNSNFFSMLTILLVFETAFSLENEQGITIEGNSDPLQPGNYYVAGRFSPMPSLRDKLTSHEQDYSQSTTSPG
jgi:hypothetical protein